MKTRFTQLTGVRYPIMQGGMQHLGVPEFAAAVSNAGGLGTINITIYPEPEEFRAAVQRTKALTDQPFAVNISLVPGLNMGETIRRYIRICEEEQVKVIETAGRNPGEFVPQIKQAGILLIHKCTTVKHAMRAVSDGADMITAAGFEVGGHPGANAVGTFLLTNLISSAVDVPVLAAGGVADGRGLAAALALGAEGVMIGTRFVATDECVLHQNFKEILVNKSENDTVLIQKSIGNMCRCYRNKQAEKALELDECGASVEEQMPVISGSHAKRCYVSGDVEACIFSVGQAMGLIHDIKPVSTVIEEIVAGAQLEAERIRQCLHA